MSTRFAQYQVGLAPEPDSFWRENVIAVVIVLRVLVSGNKLCRQTSQKFTRQRQKEESFTSHIHERLPWAYSYRERKR